MCEQCLVVIKQLHIFQALENYPEKRMKSYLAVTYVNVSVDANGHDIHQRRKTGDYAECSDEDAQGISLFKPHLSLHDTCNQYKYKIRV